MLYNRSRDTPCSAAASTARIARRCGRSRGDDPSPDFSARPPNVRRRIMLPPSCGLPSAESNAGTGSAPRGVAVAPSSLGVDNVRDRLNAALANRYRIERELGGGGMSRVFQATETDLGRAVVIKVVSTNMLEGVSADRFTREVKLAARLQQAN